MKLLDKPLKARDRQAVRGELEKLRDAHPEKLIVPEQVVERARDETSALHWLFQWDDNVAAHQWRLMQARSVISSIDVYYADDADETPLPRFVSLAADRKKPGGGYRDTRSVLSSKKLMAELEATAQKDIDGVLRRYEMLKQFCERVRSAAGLEGQKPTKPKKRTAPRR